MKYPYKSEPKNHCVRCGEEIDKNNYEKNGNYCLKCNASVGKLIKIRQRSGGCKKSLIAL